jgi:hypothetical protein
MQTGSFLIALGLAISIAAIGRPQTPARLGGAVNTFIENFGKPFRNVGTIYHFQKCPGRSSLPRWSLSTENDRVIVIVRNACEGQKLDPAESRREAAQFVPTDAGPPRRFVTEDGWTAEKRRSASLALALPASAFTACEGKANERGAFSYVLSPERSMWTLAVGTCP